MEDGRTSVSVMERHQVLLSNHLKTSFIITYTCISSNIKDMPLIYTLKNVNSMGHPINSHCVQVFC